MKRELWDEGRDKEYDNSSKREAWQHVDRGSVAPNQKILGTKNVYKVKRDPVTEEVKYKVRNVVKGYMQEQGIDYTEAFAGQSPEFRAVGVIAAVPF
jgi:hypothetical protein